MNHAISIILSDIDILLLKSEDKATLQPLRENIKHFNTPLDVIDKKNEKDDEPIESNNEIKSEKNASEIKDDCSEEDSNSLPTISECDTESNNAIICNYAVDNPEGNVTYALEGEIGGNMSLRMFVRKFDEVAQNINRILQNLAEKQN